MGPLLRSLNLMGCSLILASEPVHIYLGLSKSKPFIMKTQCTYYQRCLIRTARTLGLVLLLCLFTQSVFAQSGERTVSGVVTSSDGPVFGAVVMLQGTNVGAVTNEKGEFTFPQPLKEEDVLIATYFGYENAEVVIENNTSFVKPFLADIPVIIRVALRTEPTAAAVPDND